MYYIISGLVEPFVAIVSVLCNRLCPCIVNANKLGQQIKSCVLNLHLTLLWREREKKLYMAGLYSGFAGRSRRF